jgi:hypothetical protein
VMLEVFDPASECPPDGGGSTDVRFFAGDSAPSAAFNAYAAESDCGNPFLWVRVVKRYRLSSFTSRRRGDFPSPAVDANPCGAPRAVQIEIGVARCAPSATSAAPTWAEYATEAEYSLDDSWRLELVLCRAMGTLRSSEKGSYDVGIDAIIPEGPEGGVMGWTALAYVEF